MKNLENWQIFIYYDNIFGAARGDVQVEQVQRQYIKTKIPHHFSVGFPCSYVSLPSVGKSAIKDSHIVGTNPNRIRSTFHSSVHIEPPVVPVQFFILGDTPKLPCFFVFLLGLIKPLQSLADKFRWKHLKGVVFRESRYLERARKFITATTPKIDFVIPFPNVSFCLM